MPKSNADFGTDLELLIWSASVSSRAEQRWFILWIRHCSKYFLHRPAHLSFSSELGSSFVILLLSVRIKK